MKAVSLQVLFVLRVLCLVTLAGGQPKAPLKCSKECGRFSSEIAEKWIRSYRWTEPRCRKRAVMIIVVFDFSLKTRHHRDHFNAAQEVGPKRTCWADLGKSRFTQFTTLKSIEICANPNVAWVEKIVAKLDQKKAAASPLPRDATSAVAPEEPRGFQKHVGLTVTAPSQTTAPSGFLQGTGATVLERTRVPAASTEVSSKSPPATRDTTRLPGGSSPAIGEVVARSEVTPEANRGSLKSPAPATIFAAGMASSQPTPYPTLLVRGFDNAVGSTEGPVGHTANTTPDVRGTTSPGSNSDPVAIIKGSDHPVLSSSDLPSILDSVEIATVPATLVPPETTSVSTLNSTTAIDKGPSVHGNKVVSSFVDASGTRTLDYSLPAGKQEPSDTLVFTRQAFSGQARAQMTTERPNDLALPSFLSRSQTHFVIPACVVGGLMACSVAFVWLYLKLGVKTEETSREMVQGLLYQKERHQNDVYPMEVI